MIKRMGSESSSTLVFRGVCVYPQVSFLCPHTMPQLPHLWTKGDPVSCLTDILWRWEALYCTWGHSGPCSLFLIWDHCWSRRTFSARFSEGKRYSGTTKQLFNWWKISNWKLLGWPALQSLQVFQPHKTGPGAVNWHQFLPDQLWLMNGTYALLPRPWTGWPWTVMTLAWDGFFPRDHLCQPLSCLTLVPCLCWDALLTLSLCHLPHSRLAQSSPCFSCSGTLVLPSLHLSSPPVGILYYSLPGWSYPRSEADVVSEIHPYLLGLNCGPFSDLE